MIINWKNFLAILAANGLNTKVLDATTAYPSHKAMVLGIVDDP
jgi:hypothetical protein